MHWDDDPNATGFGVRSYTALQSALLKAVRPLGTRGGGSSGSGLWQNETNRLESPATMYEGPSGAGLTLQECQQANASAADAKWQAQQRADQEARQAAQAERLKRAAMTAQAVSSEEARGYKPVTFKDSILDAKACAAEHDVKVSVPGFYKPYGRWDERLYASYDDFMMHTYHSVEARYIGLITDGGSCNLQDYLMQCGATIGCPITILGHVSPCTEANVFGAATGDFASSPKT
jgi:hypothetical protein